MLASDFNFDLPDALIAQEPARPRDAARLLVPNAARPDRVVSDLAELLRPGDLLVANDTRVIPAQLDATRSRQRGATEARIGITLDRPGGDGTWRVLVRNARRIVPGDSLDFAGHLRADVLTVAGGTATLRFDREGEAFDAALRQAGRLALPPYIHRPTGPTEADRRDYQTTFAQADGAVAAPTAGLHFTPALLASLDARGVRRATVTLHVGAGTFLPMRHERVEDHDIHAERGEITDATADAIAGIRARGGRVVACGTTTLRLLESAAAGAGRVAPFRGETRLFILPGFQFQVADMLMTNFHLPRSTLFMLVCAFAGAEPMKRAYAHAIAAGYRFYSYGDASLLERAA